MFRKLVQKRSTIISIAAIQPNRTSERVRTAAPPRRSYGKVNVNSGGGVKLRDASTNATRSIERLLL